MAVIDVLCFKVKTERDCQGSLIGRNIGLNWFLFHLYLLIKDFFLNVEIVGFLLTSRLRVIFGYNETYLEWYQIFI
ncbi:MAG: hypothetical protein D8M28_05505 [Proteobacteria bacterium]|nr:hypothetical protein [Pseudomonadota bacterium]